ncbi:MAG: PqiC family protein [Pseudomonadales bacterium]|jgi:uncharacterized lipoprotein YmbA|nr:PqiC family protein [Pseudomonadales bacterium]
MRASAGRFAPTLLLVAALAGCVAPAPVPEPATYLLRSAVQDRTSTTEPHFTLGRVRVAWYLEQLGIVLETDAGEIRPARYHRWAEPLDRGIRQLVADLAARELGQPVAKDPERAAADALRVDIVVDSFHGTADGAAVLDAEWTIFGPGSPSPRLLHRRFSSRASLAAAGYPALVAAEVRLLEELAVLLAADLATAAATGPSAEE